MDARGTGNLRMGGTSADRGCHVVGRSSFHLQLETAMDANHKACDIVLMASGS